MNNLKPIMDKERAIKLGRKGGLSKSPRKTLASRINGLKSLESTDERKQAMIQLLKEKRFVDVIIELISMNMEDLNNPHRRDKVIDQLSKFIPNQILSIELQQKEQDSSFQESKNVLFEAIKEVCPDKMVEINEYLERRE